MKRFVFPLERALEIRRMQADAEEAKLEVLVGAKAEQERARAARVAERDGCWEAPRWGETGDARALGAAERYRRHLTSVIQTIDLEIARLETAIESQRAQTVEAKRRQKLLEKLRSQRWREWEEASVRELDELAADAHRARLHGSRRAEKREVLGGVFGQTRE